MSSGELIPPQRIGCTVVQFADAHAVNALIFHLQHRSEQKLNRHLFYGKPNRIRGGGKPAIANGPIAPLAAAWEQISWRVVVERRHGASPANTAADVRT